MFSINSAEIHPLTAQSQGSKISLSCSSVSFYFLCVFTPFPPTSCDSSPCWTLTMPPYYSSIPSLLSVRLQTQSLQLPGPVLPLCAQHWKVSVSFWKTHLHLADSLPYKILPSPKISAVALSLPALLVQEGEQIMFLTPGCTKWDVLIPPGWDRQSRVFQEGIGGENVFSTSWEGKREDEEVQACQCRVALLGQVLSWATSRIKTSLLVSRNDIKSDETMGRILQSTRSLELLLKGFGMERCYCQNFSSGCFSAFLLIIN